MVLCLVMFAWFPQPSGDWIGKFCRVVNSYWLCNVLFWVSALCLDLLYYWSYTRGILSCLIFRTFLLPPVTSLLGIFTIHMSETILGAFKFTSHYLLLECVEACYHVYFILCFLFWGSSQIFIFFILLCVNNFLDLSY